MGVWTKGDYSILVPLESISLHLNRCQHSIQRSLDYYSDKDSSLANYFLATSNRHKTTVNQLDKVKNGSGIMEKAFVSVDGIGSSLRRMYVYFDIKESKYKKISLIMAAIKASN